VTSTSTIQRPRIGRPPSTPVGTLRAARNLIEADGLTKGCIVDSRGRHCITGAVAEVVGAKLVVDKDAVTKKAFTSDKSYALYQEAISLLEPHMGNDVVFFNETRGVGITKVLKAFDEAIDVAQKKQWVAYKRSSLAAKS
jgi:hypothetical protein